MKIGRIETFILGTGSSKDLLFCRVETEDGLHGWGEAGPELTRLSREGRWAEMARLVDDDMLEAFAIVAPPQEVPRRLAQRCAGAVNRVSFISQTPPAALLDALREPRRSASR